MTREARRNGVWRGYGHIREVQCLDERLQSTTKTENVQSGILAVKGLDENLHPNMEIDDGMKG